MRKNYPPLLALLAMMLVSVTAKAAIIPETLTANLDAVAANFEDFVVYHYWNFRNMSKDGGENGVFATDIHADAQALGWMAPLTTPGYENFLVQMGRGTIAEPELRYRSSYGLYEFGSGARELRIPDMQAGMIVVMEGAANGNYPFDETGVLGTGAEEITEEVHEAQLNAEVEEGETATADSYRYFRILEDGSFRFSVNRACYVVTVAVLRSASAAEAVTSPSLKVEDAYGASRTVSLIPGSSSQGSEVQVIYTLDGSDPLLMKDSEKVDHYAVLDDEGAEAKTYTIAQYEAGEVLEEDAPLVVPIYKKVFAVEEGTEFAGDFEWLWDYLTDNAELYDGNSFSVSKDDWDEVSDGVLNDVVTIKAVTVSATGAISAIVKLAVDVSTIYLNDPTLTLIGFDGLDRQYRFNWADNTKGDANVSITYEADGGERVGELTNGDVLAFTEECTITIDAGPAYESSVTTWQADMAGVELKRKSGGAAAHDWDFVNITDYQKALFYQDPMWDESIVVEYKLEEDEGDEIKTTTISVEEYQQRLLEEEDMSAWKPVLKPSGWWTTIASNRTSLNLIEGGGNDQNSNGFGYEDDQTGIFDGLSISCPPNANNASCILKYLDKADWAEGGYNGDGITQLGVYFMARPTITFSRAIARAGEIVEIYYGQGGSNYTNSRTKGLYTVPADGLLKVELPNGGVHVFYIDVYTYEGVEDIEDSYMTGVESIEVQPAPASAAIYNMAGQRVDESYKGIVIKNGKKYLVK